MFGQYEGLALFSGGLDSILAARLLMAQGKKILCVHFCSPFFGKPHLAKAWEAEYGLTIQCVDIADAYIHLLHNPAHGFGSVVNPCIDCKIFMMRKAKALMPEYGARFLISGEVIGQRPMSQRKDTLNVIKRDAEVKDCLIRPLCAKCLDPTPMEEEGLIDRDNLKGFFGRSRNNQMALAKEMGITKIPTPGGGCLLTEKESARRYWPLLREYGWVTAKDVQNTQEEQNRAAPCTFVPSGQDFYLANTGRQMWCGSHWLCIGRNQTDNEQLQHFFQAGDALFKADTFPGPLALGRGAATWSTAMQQEAAALVLSYAPKAVQAYQEEQNPLGVGLYSTMADFEAQTPSQHVFHAPKRENRFVEQSWQDIEPYLKALHKMPVLE